MIDQPKTAAFWQAYLATVPDPAAAAARFYEVFRIGDTPADADLGAQLTITGQKTTTSALLWEYEPTGKAPPQVGALSIVEDGSGDPVCVVETIWLAVWPLNGVQDLDFIRGYAEWGETAASWQARAWAYYAPHCRALGMEPAQDMPMLCERYRVVYPVT
jgi:uncharacterized protein YhfF